jgi:hypothetical protein
MNLFRYETHLHTKEASACAISSGVEQVQRYKELGYAGVIVTDHFFNGNSCIPSELPWEERVSLLYKGYENAKEEGDRIGLSVFFGWETNFDTTEFLIYGLDKAWLLKNPDILSWSIAKQYERVKEAGGYIVHAHPFRKRPYIKEIRLFPEYVDAVEAINVGNRNDGFDKQAQAYAKKNKLPMSAGTDSHGLERLHSGVAFRHKLENIEDFIASMRSGKYELIKPN